MKKFTAIALMPLVASGCFLQKKKDEATWKPHQVAQIVAGRSTRADVLRVLGPPTKIVKLAESEAYVYRHRVEKRTGMFAVLLATDRSDRQYDAVTVIVDAEGIVQAVGHRFSAARASFGMPWSD